MLNSLVAANLKFTNLVNPASSHVLVKQISVVVEIFEEILPLNGL